MYEECQQALMMETRTLTEEQAFCHWISGFVDGEGCFHISREASRGRVSRRCAFQVNVRKDDEVIIRKMHRLLGGNICYEAKKGNMQPKVQWSVRDLDELSRLVSFFSTYRLQAKKKLDFRVWRYAVELCWEVKSRPIPFITGAWRQGSKPKWASEDVAEYDRLYNRIKKVRDYQEVEVFGDNKPTISEEAFGHWLSGFTDGEGCFVLDSQVRPTHFQPVMSFRIKLRKDDWPVLHRIQNYLGCGSIRDCTPDNHHPRVYFMVSSIEDMAEKIVPHFDKFPLRAKKKRDYVVWRKAVMLMKKVRDLPMVGRRNGKTGWEPKWKGEPVDQFLELQKEIKTLRLYKEEGAA